MSPEGEGQSRPGRTLQAGFVRELGHHWGIIVKVMRSMERILKGITLARPLRL